MKKYFVRRKNTSLEEVVLGKTRVILISEDYGVRNADPVWGSSYQCVGTAERIAKVGTDFPIIVKWDNGANSAYRAIDLQVYSDEEMKSNPNFAFKRAKRTGTSRLMTTEEKESLGNPAKLGYNGVKLAEKTKKPFKFGDAPLAPKEEVSDDDEELFEYIRGNYEEVTRRTK